MEICLDLWETPEIGKIMPSLDSPIRVFKLAEGLKLGGAKIFDAALAAVAEENGVKQIYTQSIEDFVKFEFLKTVNPLT